MKANQAYWKLRIQLGVATQAQVVEALAADSPNEDIRQIRRHVKYQWDELRAGMPIDDVMPILAGGVKRASHKLARAYLDSLKPQGDFGGQNINYARDSVRDHMIRYDLDLIADELKKMDLAPDVDRDHLYNLVFERPLQERAAQGEVRKRSAPVGAEHKMGFGSFGGVDNNKVAAEYNRMHESFYHRSGFRSLPMPNLWGLDQ